jgi:glycosyltransferase involved in cell wall biosynthesis
MKIGIDLLPLQSDPKRRGISNFVYNLLKEIIKIDVKNEYYLYNAKKVSLDFINNNDSRIQLIKTNISPKESESLDLFIFTSFFDFEKKIIEPADLLCKTIVIVYDIIPIILWDNYIEFFSNETKFEYFRRINSIRKCDKILTISQSVKKDLIEILEMPENAIDVIYAGIDQNDNIIDNDKQLFEKLKQKFHIKNKYIFSVPSMDYRKNIFGLINAYAQLPEILKNEFQLVISNEITEDYKKMLYNHASDENLFHDKLILTNYVTETDLKILYKNANLFVFPSFNEGFGLPVLEAMFYGIPVITSNLSSLPEITGDAGVLVNPYNSSEISQAMKAILSDSELQKNLIAKSKIQAKKFSWNKTAQLTLSSCENFYHSEKRIRMGLVTPWNTKCGIAEYSKYLIEGIRDIRIVILANYEDNLINPDGINVERCWTAGWTTSSDNYNSLYNKIIQNRLDLIHFEFNFGLFHLPDLMKLISRLKNKGISVLITFHATKNVKISNVNLSLSSLIANLQTLDKIIVHTENDRKRLENFSVIKNVALLPQGIKIFNFIPTNKIREELHINQSPVIAAFGFLLPHKGIFECIRAIAILQKEYPDILFLVVSALYPVDESKNYFEKCRNTVLKSGLEKNVIFFPEFMDDSKSNTILQASDIIVMPYQQTNESSSAATKFALSAKKPIIVTDIPIFDEYNDEVFKINTGSPEDIADGIKKVLRDKELQLNLVNNVENKIKAENWSRITQEYEKLIYTVQSAKKSIQPDDKITLS